LLNDKLERIWKEAVVTYQVTARRHFLATLEGGSCTKNMTSTGGCSYSVVYSWWWVYL